MVRNFTQWFGDLILTKFFFFFDWSTLSPSFSQKLLHGKWSASTDCKSGHGDSVHFLGDLDGLSSDLSVVPL